jgi:hypothetical protein
VVVDTLLDVEEDVLLELEDEALLELEVEDDDLLDVEVMIVEGDAEEREIVEDRVEDCDAEEDAA